MITLEIVATDVSVTISRVNPYQAIDELMAYILAISLEKIEVTNIASFSKFPV
jgi:hypothetical protein